MTHLQPTTDPVELIEEMQLKNERYIGDYIEELWNTYHTTKDKRIRDAAKKKYNEFAGIENKRREQKNQLKLL